jgi:hypothetical protein
VQWKDKAALTSSVGALCDAAIAHWPDKYACGPPDACPAWFDAASLRFDASFRYLSRDEARLITRNGTWLEWKVLQVSAMIYSELLVYFPAMSGIVPRNYLTLANAAVKVGDAAVVALCVKFFNTAVRASLTKGKVSVIFFFFFFFFFLLARHGFLTIMTPPCFHTPPQTDARVLHCARLLPQADRGDHRAWRPAGAPGAPLRAVPVVLQRAVSGPRAALSVGDGRARPRAAC